MFKSFNTQMIALTAAAAMAQSAPAMAQDAAAARVRVSYADLNLASSAGAKALLERIRTAADTACGGAPDIHAIAMQRPFQACRSLAVEQAVGTVGAPALIAVTHRKTSTGALAAR